MEEQGKKEKRAGKDLGWILAPVGALILVVGLIAGGVSHMPEIGQTISASGALMLIIGSVFLRIQNRKRRQGENGRQG